MYVQVCVCEPCALLHTREHPLIVQTRLFLLHRSACGRASSRTAKCRPSCNSSRRSCGRAPSTGATSPFKSCSCARCVQSTSVLALALHRCSLAHALCTRAHLFGTGDARRHSDFLPSQRVRAVRASRPISAASTVRSPFRYASLVCPHRSDVQHQFWTGWQHHVERLNQEIHAGGFAEHRCSSCTHRH
jgi:hypothetical protein